MDSGGTTPVPKPHRRKLAVWTAAAVAGGGVVAAIVSGVAWLWGQLDQMAGNDPRAQITAVGTTVSIVFGLGGLATLGLLIHRQILQQRHQRHLEEVATNNLKEARERLDQTAKIAADNLAQAQKVAAATERDAIEKRAQELFTKAVEQLGHEKAAVRVGALHALDGLGQEHPKRRRAVMDVWCAYLRMPPPPVKAKQDLKGKKKPKPVAADTESAGAVWPAEELQVRATAQRLIAEHLRDSRSDDERATGTPAPEAFWGAMDIDLTGAHLHDFGLNRCHLNNATFTNARFAGPAGFAGARFAGPAGFAGARFAGVAGFIRARFAGDAWFDEATFAEDAEFIWARFAGDAWFDEATFAGDTRFGEAKFAGDTRFGEAKFAGYVEFRRAEFAGCVEFGEATFAGIAWFGDTKFAGVARFDDAEFVKPGEVNPGARLHLVFNHELPEGWRASPLGGEPGRLLEWDPEFLAAAVVAAETEAG